jgi:hypothetical protein
MEKRRYNRLDADGASFEASSLGMTNRSLNLDQRKKGRLPIIALSCALGKRRIPYPCCSGKTGDYMIEFPKGTLSQSSEQG